MPGESGGEPTSDDGDVLVSSQENAPRRPATSGPVSPPLPRGSIPCRHVQPGEGAFPADVERHVHHSATVVRTVRPRLTCRRRLSEHILDRQ